MRMLLAIAVLFATAATAQDAPKPLSVAIEPLGDRSGGVVTRVFFRFANPREVSEAGLFLEGAFRQVGQVDRNFRYAVPRKDDKWLWSNTVARNDKVLRETRWTLLPDLRNELAATHTFAAGKAEIEVRLVLERDFGRAPIVVAETTETFTLTKTNRPFVVAVEEREEAAPAPTSPVTIRAMRPTVTPNVFLVSVDALPPVKRVEFRIEDRKVLVRNSPPYVAELDLGDSHMGRAVRAIGFDAAGRYVDADTFVVREDDGRLAVKITRIATPDGVTHFKMSIRNATAVKRVVLYAGDKKLHEWSGPPFTLNVPTASLAGVDTIRATVVDESGAEGSDVVR